MYALFPLYGSEGLSMAIYLVIQILRVSVTVSSPSLIEIVISVGPAFALLISSVEILEPSSWNIETD